MNRPTQRRTGFIRHVAAVVTMLITVTSLTGCYTQLATVEDDRRNDVYADDYRRDYDRRYDRVDRRDVYVYDRRPTRFRHLSVYDPIYYDPFYDPFIYDPFVSGVSVSVSFGYGDPFFYDRFYQRSRFYGHRPFFGYSRYHYGYHRGGFYGRGLYNRGFYDGYSRGYYGGFYAQETLRDRRTVPRHSTARTGRSARASGQSDNVRTISNGRSATAGRRSRTSTANNAATSTTGRSASIGRVGRTSTSDQQSSARTTTRTRSS